MIAQQYKHACAVVANSTSKAVSARTCHEDVERPKRQLLVLLGSLRQEAPQVANHVVTDAEDHVITCQASCTRRVIIGSTLRSIVISGALEKRMLKLSFQSHVVYMYF